MAKKTTSFCFWGCAILVAILSSCYNGDAENSPTTSEISNDVIKDAADSSSAFTGEFLPNAKFDTVFTLQPPQPEKNSDIRCTFDGSEPDSTTEIFSKEKLIDSTTVVRCAEFFKSTLIQKRTETYFINEDIHMPVISISVSPDYVSEYLEAAPCKPNPCSEAKFWEDVEYPAHVEYFANGSSSNQKDFEIDAGISIAGNWTRNQEKKSVSIVMRKQYEEGRINFPLFDTRPENSTFKAFNLRNNGNRFSSDYIEDAMATSLLEGTNVDYQRSRQVVVFYNGVFHGIYDMREKLNEHFIETNYNVKNADFIKHHSNIEIEAQNGSERDYVNMLEYVYQADFSDSTEYKTICEMIDMSNYIDYMIAQIYYHNDDWPQNNVRAWKTLNSPWRFIAYDIDYGFGFTATLKGFSETTNMLEWITSGGRSDRVCATTNDPKCFHNIFAKLIKNTSFKQAFINRATYLFSTFLNSQKVTERINSINKTIDFNQVDKDRNIYTRPSYKNSCGTGFDIYGECLKTWAKTRDETVRTEFRDYFDLGKDITFTLQIKGNANVHLDDFFISHSSSLTWITFEEHPIHVKIECNDGTQFKSWENGSTDPEREIQPQSEINYIAECSL